MADFSGLLFKKKEAIKVALVKTVLDDTVLFPFGFSVDSGHFCAYLAGIGQNIAIQ